MSLASLIAEVEKLTGPNYEIERRVTEVTGYPNVYRQPDGTIPHNATFPAFTASLDAVVALIERELPGWKWHIHNYPAAMICRDWNDDDAPVFRSARDGWKPARHTSFERWEPEPKAATHAIALLLAFLRAIEARAG